MDAEGTQTRPGIVTSVSARTVQVHVDGVGDVRCSLRAHLWDSAAGETRPVAVGDRVEVTLEGDDAGAIESVGARTNQLGRPKIGGRPGQRQVIAANLDRLIIVAALTDPPFRPGLVDRFLVAARMQGLDSVICLNKVDLSGDRSVVEPFREAGIAVLETSVPTGEGIDELAALMKSGTSLLIGHSGVGKSSLLNAIAPDLAQATGRVAEHHGRGRHTTTRVTLLHLPSGGWVVDSPGIREFGLDQVELLDLARLFPGFGEIPDGCHFSDCLHDSEPRCAVRAAVEAGTLSADRYASYLRALEDLRGR